MNSFHIILTLLILAFGSFLFIINAKSTEPTLELADEEADELLENEIYQLMKTINAANLTEEERQARYRDIKNKYKDTFTVLGHDFPEYSSLKR
ncbi:hypothetical protein GCM10027037_19470 [Mucilaginibacter koreensis]